MLLDNDWGICCWCHVFGTIGREPLSNVKLIGGPVCGFSDVKYVDMMVGPPGTENGISADVLSGGSTPSTSIAVPGGAASASRPCGGRGGGGSASFVGGSEGSGSAWPCDTSVPMVDLDCRVSEIEGCR
jgi:hypothetical protein